MSSNHLLKKDIADSFFQDKKDKTAYWLSIFQYTPPSILLGYLDRKDKSALRSLKKNGFIEVLKTDMVSSSLLIFGSSGFKYAREKFDSSNELRSTSSRINQSLIPHEIALQKHIIKKRGLICEIKSAKQLYHLDIYKEKSKIPDAIIEYKLDGKKQAIELERSHKSTPRVFIGFYNHAYAIAKLKKYYSVEYVFPTKTLADNYQKKFNSIEWPVYEFSKYKKRYQLLDKPFICPKELKERFIFTVMEMD